jgi:hypothetical protein
MMQRHDDDKAALAAVLLVALTFAVIWLVEHFRP